MGTIDAAAGTAQLQVVAGHSPGGLLLELHSGHALLEEEALFLGDDQGGRIGEGDEAQLHAGGFGLAGGSLGGASTQQGGETAELNHRTGGDGQAGAQDLAASERGHGGIR